MKTTRETMVKIENEKKIHQKYRKKTNNRECEKEESEKKTRKVTIV